MKVECALRTGFPLKTTAVRDKFNEYIRSSMNQSIKPQNKCMRFEIEKNLRELARHTRMFLAGIHLTLCCY